MSNTPAPAPTTGTATASTDGKGAKAGTVLLQHQQHLTAAAAVLQSIAKPCADAVTFCLPTILMVCSKLWLVYKTMPKNALKFWTGFVFCFFGGMYPVTFAAVEAAEHGGRSKVVEALQALSEEAQIILEESKKDDAKDDDKDGISDVAQIDGSKYALRKFTLVMTKMNPEKVDTAIATIYRVWMSVVAVLVVQFARTIALALSISDFVKPPVDRYVAPTIAMATPVQYRKWVPVVLGWMVKSLAMSVAWYIQTVISAVTSALAGGQMMGRAAFDFCQHHKLTLGGIIPADANQTYMDEIMAYVFAALGIWFQFKMKFDMPFPFNYLLWPLEFFEYYLKWTITSKSD